MSTKNPLSKRVTAGNSENLQKAMEPRHGEIMEYSVPVSPGNWVPISKALLSELPKGRDFTRLEAMLSLTVDYDQGNLATVNGYAASWGWSRGKVRRFLSDAGVSIEYPIATIENQNQRGQIVIQIPDRSAKTNGQLKMIDSKWFGKDTNRSKPNNGQIANRSQNTTTEPSPKPLKDTSEMCAFFEKLWSVYPRKDGKKVAERHFLASVRNDEGKEQINLALGNYLNHLEINTVEPKYIKTGSTFFSNWQDWIPEGEDHAV